MDYRHSFKESETVWILASLNRPINQCNEQPLVITLSLRHKNDHF